LLRRWISQSRLRAKPAARQTKALALPAQSQFIALQVQPNSVVPGDIQIDLQRAGTTVRVQWPVCWLDFQTTRRKLRLE